MLVRRTCRSSAAGGLALRLKRTADLRELHDGHPLLQAVERARADPGRAAVPDAADQERPLKRARVAVRDVPGRRLRGRRAGGRDGRGPSRSQSRGVALAAAATCGDDQHGEQEQASSHACLY
jgi:hypothetical protein